MRELIGRAFIFERNEKGVYMPVQEISPDTLNPSTPIIQFTMPDSDLWHPGTTFGVSSTDSPFPVPDTLAVLVSAEAERISSPQG